MKKELFIKEIEDYQDIVYTLREENQDYYSITEFDSVYQDILDYQEDQFEDWTTKDFKEFIKYLEQLTGLKSKLKEVL
jgi:uncharacterized protein YozE (UPF0346 family)